MGLKLQKPILTIFLIFSILLVWGGRDISQAQISLDNDSPLEIRFSQGQTVRNQTSVTVGLSDLKSILSSEFTLSQNQWQPYGESENSGTNYFISENSAFVSPGRIQIEGFPYQTFFISTFENNSGKSIGNLVVAYDFIYNFYQGAETPDLELRYKVNDGEWKSIKSGIVNSSSLRSDENTWSSFSIQLNIDEIFLRQSDQIHLMWVIDEKEPVIDQMPLALQRMEIMPDEMDQNLLGRGDILITEILPKSNVNGSDFEYIEIYNPGEFTVNLKGIELISSLGSKVVQQDVYVEPYSFTVISNVDISSLESVSNSYFYNGSIVAENGGRIELEREGSLIASATYEASESGVALELNQASRAYDGYSSLQDFAPSQLTYFQDLHGSPGVGGGTNPMFTKVLVESGVYIMSFPGKPIQRLNRRHSSIEFYSLNGDALTLDAIEPNQPVLVRKVDNNPLRVFSEAEFSTSSSGTPVFPVTPNSSLVSTPVRSGVDGKPMQKSENVLRTIPITQTWNSQRQKFELQMHNQIAEDHWSPVVMSNSVSTLIKNPDSQITSPNLDRFIEFTLSPNTDNEIRTEDVAILGFLDSPSQHSHLRYDLPKLELNRSRNIEDKKQPLLYMASTLSPEHYNSFTHLPSDVEEEYEIGIGTKMADNTGSASLKWTFNNELPEEWVITIEDTFEGTTVNLREENEYRFRYSTSGEVSEARENDLPSIATLEPQDRPRFILKVQPYAAFSENSEESETPDSIELQPNYPNPFNPSTNINFFLPEERKVRVGIYNIVGQQVALLLDDTIQQGEHSLQWDAADKPSGIYIVQLEAGNRIFTRKITLIK